MSKKKPKPQPDTEKPRVHPDLEGFDIKINSFGEVNTSYDIDKINLFLNRHVNDKKLRDRDDVPGRDEGETDEDAVDATADDTPPTAGPDDDDDPEGTPWARHDD